MVYCAFDERRCRGQAQPKAVALLLGFAVPRPTTYQHIIANALLFGGVGAALRGYRVHEPIESGLPARDEIHDAANNKVGPLLGRKKSASETRERRAWY